MWLIGIISGNLSLKSNFQWRFRNRNVQITTSGVSQEVDKEVDKEVDEEMDKEVDEEVDKEVGGGGLVGWHCTVVILHTSHPVVRLTAGPVTLSHCAVVPALRRLPLSSNTRDKSQL